MNTEASTTKNRAGLHYFSAVHGAPVELTNIQHSGEVSRAAREFTGRCECGARHVCDRVVDYKKNPSEHPCGPRCLNAKGGTCECACGGAHHGETR